MVLLDLNNRGVICPILSGIVKHYRHKVELFTLAQNGDKDCVFLDLETRKCSITRDRRPKSCREYPLVGPRPGFCPYVRKEKESEEE